MKRTDTPDETRRRLVRIALGMPVALALPSVFAVTACASGADAATGLQPTPACSDEDDEPTPSQTEGPYFTPNSPERTSLIESGVTGTSLIVTGQVVTRSCQPVAKALLDVWQADDSGNYDNVGYRLRGHQFTNSQGVYRLETIVPGLYPGRTRHIHVKVQAPSQSILTTQLYFPGESRNASDGIYDDALLMAMTDITGGRQGQFNFVLDLA